MLTWKACLLGSLHCYPLINPIGAALVFVGLVEDAGVAVYKRLSLQIALVTFGFLLFVEFLGSLLLSFFGVSIPAVQVTGGITSGLLSQTRSYYVRLRVSVLCECSKTGHGCISFHGARYPTCRFLYLNVPGYPN